jgi:hypothetical protein
MSQYCNLTSEGPTKQQRETLSVWPIQSAIWPIGSVQTSGPEPTFGLSQLFIFVIITASLNLLNWHIHTLWVYFYFISIVIRAQIK